MKTKLDVLNEEYQSRNDYDNNELMTKSYEAEITKLKNEIDHLKTATIIDGNETKKENECDHPSSLNNISQKLIETKNEEIDDLHTEIDGLKCELNEKSVQHEKAIIDLKKQQEIVLELNLKLEEVSNASDSLQKCLESLTTEKDLTLSQVKQLEEKLDLINNENEKLTSDVAQLNELNSEYRDLLDQYDLKMEELTKENDGLKAEKARLSEHVEVKEKIIENLNVEINEMNQIKLDMEKEQSEHSEVISKAESIPIEEFNEQKVL